MRFSLGFCWLHRSGFGAPNSGLHLRDTWYKNCDGEQNNDVKTGGEARDGKSILKGTGHRKKAPTAVVHRLEVSFPGCFVQFFSWRYHCLPALCSAAKVSPGIRANQEFGFVGVIPRSARWHRLSYSPRPAFEMNRLPFADAKSKSFNPNTSLFAISLSELKELLLFKGRAIIDQKCEVHVLRRLIRNEGDGGSDQSQRFDGTLGRIRDSAGSSNAGRCVGGLGGRAEKARSDGDTGSRRE
jgi:hypothetical protein